PPRDAYGRPSFRRVLREVARVWTEERDRVKAAAAAIGERLGAVLAGEAASGEPAPELLVGALEALAQVYDPRHGGFGGAPKFPNVGALAFLLDCALESGGVPKSAPGPGGREQADRGRAMLVHTLRAMSDGGIHDQLGGGFHRYATDAQW